MRQLPLVLCALLACVPAAASADSWTTVEAMPHPHVQGAATLLQNGQVLVTGGFTGGEIPELTPTSDRWDPVSGHWLDTAPFATATAAQGMSLLADGRVLMTGGYRSGYGVDTPEVLGTALVYDPATNRWRGVVDMPHLHGYHAQLTLPDGRALVFGGYGSVADHNSDGADDHVEMYDPATNAWTVGATSPYYMANGTATLLGDGSVLVAGGSSSNAYRNVAMRYFPATNRWRAAGSFTDARRHQAAALLQNGKVLIAGGEGEGGRPLRTASIYDPATNSWSETVPMATARYDATATLLPNGKVLVAGGYGGSGSFLTSAELYDPATNAWSPAASLATGRFDHTATLLADGRVLVTSGFGASTHIEGDSTTLSSAELYTPDGWPFPSGGGSGGGGGGGTGGGSNGAPSISSLALSATRFRAAGSGPSVTAARKRPPVGTTISYRDGAAATATFLVQRPAAGRKSAGRCVKPTRANRAHHRCTRWVTVGRFRHTDAAGTNTLHFSGRDNGHKLHPGRYRLTVNARVGRGTPSAAALAGFRIVG